MSMLFQLAFVDSKTRSSSRPILISKLNKDTMADSGCEMMGQLESINSEKSKVGECNTSWLDGEALLLDKVLATATNSLYVSENKGIFVKEHPNESSKAPQVQAYGSPG